MPIAGRKPDRDADGGSVTIEAAIGLAVLALVLAACLAGIACLMAQLRCADAAREAARLAGRGTMPLRRGRCRRSRRPGRRCRCRVAGIWSTATVTAAPVGGLLPGVRSRPRRPRPGSRPGPGRERGLPCEPWRGAGAASGWPSMRGDPERPRRERRPVCLPSRPGHGDGLRLRRGDGAAAGHRRRGAPGCGGAGPAAGGDGRRPGRFGRGGAAARGVEFACATAGRVAQANRVDLRSCSADGLDLLVEVDAEVAGGAVFAGSVIGRARAGPVDAAVVAGPG